MIFIIFKYVSYVLMVGYCFFFLYTLSQLSSRGALAGVTEMLILLYVTVPVFLFALFWLVISLERHEVLGYSIAGLTCVIPILFILYSVVGSLTDNASLAKAKQNADSALYEVLQKESDSVSYELENSHPNTYFEEGEAVYIFSYRPKSSSMDYKEKILITVNIKTEEVVGITKYDEEMNEIKLK